MKHPIPNSEIELLTIAFSRRQLYAGDRRRRPRLRVAGATRHGRAGKRWARLVCPSPHDDRTAISARPAEVELSLNDQLRILQEL